MRSVVAICLLAAACEMPATMVDGPNDSFLAGDGKADTGGIAEGSPDALAVLALVNRDDATTLHESVGLEARAANNIVAYRLGDDDRAGTADDESFDTLKELDAVPYVGPAAFANLLAYARAHTPPPPPPPPPSGDWASSLPSGSFALDGDVTFPIYRAICEPNCTTRPGSDTLSLRLARGADGIIRMGYTLVSHDYPGDAITAAGRFAVAFPYSDPNWDGNIVFHGHVEPGRVVVIDDYSEEYKWRGPTGWRISTWSAGPGRATF